MPSTVFSQPEDHGLFTFFVESGPTDSNISNDKQDSIIRKTFGRVVIRYRTVQINPVFKTPGNLSPGNRIYLHLFHDVTYWATIERISLDVNRVLSIRGRIENTEAGYFLFSCSDGMVEASIHIPKENEEYIVSFAKEMAQHVVIEVHQERKDVLPEGPALKPRQNNKTR